MLCLVLATFDPLPHQDSCHCLLEIQLNPTGVCASWRYVGFNVFRVNLHLVDARADEKFSSDLDEPASEFSKAREQPGSYGIKALGFDENFANTF